jgi:2-iminobutanoate/2-iminopropanoate deaminase
MPMVMERQTVAASNKKAVQTDAAPKALGPYSQAIVANGMVFCAGQIPLDPATGELVAGGIAEQTHQVLKNLRAVLKAAGSDLDRALKTTVFLKSMDSFVAMNEVYGRPEYFGSNPPARSTVEVARLPRDVLVEIEVLALV